MDAKEEVKFIFPRPRTCGFQKVKNERLEDISTTIDDITKYFEKYGVDSIELYIEGLQELSISYCLQKQKEVVKLHLSHQSRGN